MTATPLLFITEYKVGDHTYGSEIIASDEDEAKRICEERGIGEKVLGSAELKPKITINDIHMICFMSFIALKSGKMTADEILSDRGIMHEAIHIMDGSADDETFREFEGQLRRLVEVTHSLPSIPTFSGIFNSTLFRSKSFV